MGGSGGYFSGGTDPAELSRKTREAEEKAQDESFETAVNDYLSSGLAGFNDRDTEGINSILDAVKNDLEGDIEGTVELQFGGSIAKHTYVDGLSDVDALVLMDRSDVADKDCAALRKQLRDILRARYGNDAVSEGNLAVTLTQGDKSIQLLPAVRSGGGFKISSADGKQWSQIQPRAFAKALTKANKEMSGKLVPTIKLAKAIIAKLPEKRQLSGYHVESLAINIFKSYAGSKTPKAMLRHFFDQAATHVKKPVADSTGQSVHVDEYMGAANSLKRRIASDALGRIARRMKNADGAGSIDKWKEIL